MTSLLNKSRSDEDGYNSTYFKVQDEMATESNVIRCGNGQVSPVTVRKTLIALAHESHQGIVRTAHRLREQWWWAGMDAESKYVISHCLKCQLNDETVI